MTEALSTRALLQRIANTPQSTLLLGDVLDEVGERAFGMFLLIALLPAFLPLPGIAGALSGPMVMFIGLQLLLLAPHPWLPAWLQRRPVPKQSLHAFEQRLSGPLEWLERISRPRWSQLFDRPPGRAFTGALLLVLGLLLSLPIPLTNYIFGLILVVFAIGLIERDGRTLALGWLLGLIEIAVMAYFFDRVVELVTGFWSGVAG